MTVLFEAAPVGDPARGMHLTMGYTRMEEHDAMISVVVHDANDPPNFFIECETSLNALILNGMPSSGFVSADSMVECLDKACFHIREWSQKRPKVIRPAPEPEPVTEVAPAETAAPEAPTKAKK